MSESFAQIQLRLNEIKSEIGQIFFNFILFAITVFFLFTFWFPIGDFDSNATHILKVKLLEFGPLSETATNEFQLPFPVAFDALHWPFLKIGYFITLPNFLFWIFMLYLVAVKLDATVQERSMLLLLLFAVNVIFSQLASSKSDLALGCLGIITWYSIFEAKVTRFYLARNLILIASFMGVRWHGIFLVVPLSLGLAFKLGNRFSWHVLIVLIACFPGIYFASSLDTYFSNFKRTGSFFPISSCLGGLSQGKSINDFLANLWKVGFTALLETFDVLFYLLDKYLFQNNIFDLVNRWSLGAKISHWAVAIHPEFGTFGIPFLLVLFCSLFTCFARKTNISIRWAGFTALFFFLMTVGTVKHNTFLTRYYLPFYCLGIIPTASVLARKGYATFKRLLKVLAAIALFQGIFLNRTRSFFSFDLITQEKQVLPVSTILRPNDSEAIVNIFDRTSLEFATWTGHLAYFREYIRRVHSFERLLIINVERTCGDMPFLYPFLKDRSSLNTRLANIPIDRQVQIESLVGFDKVLLVKGERASSPLAALVVAKHLTEMWRSANNEFILYEPQIYSKY